MCFGQWPTFYTVIIDVARHQRHKFIFCLNFWLLEYSRGPHVFWSTGNFYFSLCSNFIVVTRTLFCVLCSY